MTVELENVQVLGPDGRPVSAAQRKRVVHVDPPVDDTLIGEVRLSHKAAEQKRAWARKRDAHLSARLDDLEDSLATMHERLNAAVEESARDADLAQDVVYDTQIAIDRFTDAITRQERSIAKLSEELAVARTARDALINQRSAREADLGEAQDKARAACVARDHVVDQDAPLRAKAEREITKARRKLDTHRAHNAQWLKDEPPQEQVPAG